MLIDTHAHLNFPDYEKDLDSIINNSLANGVEKIICASSNLADSEKAIEVAQKYFGTVYASVGIHPQKTDPENNDSLETQLEKLAILARKPNVVAIGECGLDFSSASARQPNRDGSAPGEEDRTKEDQYLLFEGQIRLANKENLPVCVHSRKSSDETVAFLIQQFQVSDKKLRGVLHCYAAGKKNINKLAEIGFYFGIDGNVAYDEGLQNVTKEIPLQNIILETDSPFLSPIPYRGLRNEPKNVKLIAETIAKIKGISSEEIAEVTSLNAVQLFKLC